MKKFTPFLIVVLLLSGCSGLAPMFDLIVSPTPVIPTKTRTPQPTVTLIPTRDLFATQTPTPITFTPTQTPLVPEKLPTQTFSPSLTPPPITTFNASLFTPKNTGFLTVLVSNSVLYYNTGPCLPRTITVTAFVDDLIRTDMVLVFMRLREKSDTMLLGEWSSGEMIQQENGSYSYSISAINLRKYIYFRNAWLEYQLVSFDENRVELARTQIYDRTMSLIMCRSVSP